MQNYIIIHVPHASPRLPPSENGLLGAYYQIDPKPEIDLVTDWFTDILFAGHQQVAFPFSRVYCDVERLIPDPLDDRGQGFAYERTLDGRALRLFGSEDRTYLRGVYDHHHALLEQAIEQAVSLMPVLIIDAHSFSAEQVWLSGIRDRELPDICLGYHEGAFPERFIQGLVRYFEMAGWSVGLNRPYAGSIMPKRYADHPDVRSIMFEINKRLYLEPGTNRMKPEAQQVRRVIEMAVGIASNYDFVADAPTFSAA